MRKLRSELATFDRTFENVEKELGALPDNPQDLADVQNAKTSITKSLLNTMRAGVEKTIKLLFGSLSAADGGDKLKSELKKKIDDLEDGARPDKNSLDEMVFTSINSLAAGASS